MKLLMLPDPEKMPFNNGVGQVLHNYHKYLPQVNVEITTSLNDSFDVSASHLGHYPQADIHFSHGLYFNQVTMQQAQTNAQIIDAIRYAKAVIVPSEYVAKTFRREAKIDPYIIPHGIDYTEWQHDYQSENYVLWNKNRNSAVCNPQPVFELAKRFNNVRFLSTYCNETLSNIKTIGTVEFNVMKPLIQKAQIYLATAKETFGIGTLEALASGIPVLGFSHGGTKDIVTHKKDGYLASPGNYDALAFGLQWLLDNHESLRENCIAKAMQYDWLSVAKQIKNVCENV